MFWRLQRGGQRLLLQRRAISTFHMDNSARGRLQPYMGAIKLVSAVAGLAMVGVGGLYVWVSRHLEATYPTPAEVTNRQTRRLLRGAALREHIAPDPAIAYLFLLRALSQLYKDGFSERSRVVQETVVRLAAAADRMGEHAAAEQLLWDTWGVVEAAGEADARNDAGEADTWRDAQIARVARVLGPLLTRRGAHERSVAVYGAAVRALERLDDGGGSGDAVRLALANAITSLGEAFALVGDCDSAEALLASVLADIRRRPQAAGVDAWTCLDAVVMLDLAQVSLRAGRRDDSAAWAGSALAATAQRRGVWACDNCETHTLVHLGRVAEASGDRGSARVFYSRALELARRSRTGNIEQIKACILSISEDIRAVDAE
ncbi:hypothetical protein H4R26_002104 [Coemansia thaxteri]|uniref:Tetratricopeptide repeat protein n=1 Tax=Coemansia thaxteri TaxID=2663907 RepID=A0A9W8BH79_9FUNG|nr:hypothetical protein H4R26_002104 [Coemansia thaxteri]KAJ2483256.1 hypothetical protein EV174_002986 [Coemansia sp. RSA 2320]